MQAILLVASIAARIRPRPAPAQRPPGITRRCATTGGAGCAAAGAGRREHRGSGYAVGPRGRPVLPAAAHEDAKASSALIHGANYGALIQSPPFISRPDSRTVWTQQDHREHRGPSLGSEAQDKAGDGGCRLVRRAAAASLEHVRPDPCVRCALSPCSCRYPCPSRAAVRGATNHQFVVSAYRRSPASLSCRILPAPVRR